MFTVLSTEDDPKMKFTITEVDADTFVVVYETPRWNEKGIEKIVRSPQGFRMVAYQNRLGAAGDAMYETWRRLIEQSRVWDDR